MLKYRRPVIQLMQYVSGLIWTGSGFEKGHVGFQDGLIVEVGKGDVNDPLARGLIMPTFVNAHTHIADYVVPIDLSLTLSETVKPPDGLKYRVLASTSAAVQRDAMGRMSSFMFRRGISKFIDFREGGAEGSKLLSSVEDGARPVIMGKPMNPKFDKDEITEVLRIADGIGASSISDWDYSELHELSSFVRSQGKVFSIHASERIREDIDKVLDLRPSFIVHMTKASDQDLESVAKAGVTVVTCIRSNLFFGSEPPLARMIENGLDIALGTDNAMISMPDILTEMEFAARLLRRQGVKTLDSVLHMATTHGRKIINPGQLIEIRPDTRCDFVVFESKNGNPVTDLTLRSAADGPLLVCSGTNIWRGAQ